ncbi:uncharacterized protein BDR25DRAFT_255650 [Lindgomyces ingoldianus]|uniref:Uncharacterized protein n=1 Tax=Lindgomyces ingoldianus TaxID=673940 RepID=A0ACB6R5K6_9PLEO|nr:uncharacterized protein BDR25DRAFT_255650 [Lindgomyces ingoldianus]KAF2474055.1 hypothetical protein BDR25DRAFT_255650 [Lindgomyces ingoldianus]
MNPRKQEFEEESQAFLSQSRVNEHAATSRRENRNPRRRVTWCLWLLLDLTMASAIVFLLFFRPLPARDNLRKSPVPRLPRKIYTFRNDPRYAREDMFFNESVTLRTLHNWIELSSDSRGFIVIGDASPYDLPEPYEVALDRQHNGPGYMMSAFHQLHCLSYLAEHFQQGYGGVKLIDQVAHHSAHCFNYLRQGIMCSADTTLEGKTEAGPGEGSEHECTDYDALLEWANAHSAYRWREGLLPEDSIL